MDASSNNDCLLHNFQRCPNSFCLPTQSLPTPSLPLGQLRPAPDRPHTTGTAPVSVGEKQKRSLNGCNLVHTTQPNKTINNVLLYPSPPVISGPSASSATCNVVKTTSLIMSPGHPLLIFFLHNVPRPIFFVFCLRTLLIDHTRQSKGKISLIICKVWYKKNGEWIRNVKQEGGRNNSKERPWNYI